MDSPVIIQSRNCKICDVNHNMSVLDTTIEKQVRAFFGSYPEREAVRHETVIHPGEHVSHVLYIETGVITQFTITDSGNKLAMNTYKPGAFLPMMYVLEDRQNDYYFEVTSKNAKFKVAPAAEVVQFLRNNPEVTLDLLKRIYRGLDGLLKRMTDQMAGTAEDRVRTELLIMAERFGSKESDGKVSFEVTEQMIANHTGMARETVSRVLPNVITQGSGIRRKGRKFSVDMELLQ